MLHPTRKIKWICSFSGLLAAFLLVRWPLSAATSIMIEGSINQKPAAFVFDTGTGFPIVVQSRVLSRFGLKDFPPERTSRADGLTALGLTDPADATILGLRISKEQLGVIYPPVAADLNFDAIAGWPLLKRDVLSLREGGNKVEISRDLPAEVATWTKIPLVEGSHVLKLQVDPAQAPVLIDTGSQCGYQMTGPAWSEWRRMHPKAKITLRRYYSPGEGHVILEESRAAEIKIGYLVLSDVLVSGPSPLSPSQLTIAPAIGMAALARFNLVIDCKQDMSYVQAIKGAPITERYNRSGAVFVPVNDHDRTLMAIVIPGTPASLAGLETGDILIELGDSDWSQGKPAGSPNLDDMLMAKSGTRLTLVVRRGQREIGISIILQDILCDD